MATVQPDDLEQVKRATAALVACIVQTLDESDRTYSKRFVERLEYAYAEMRDGHPVQQGRHVLETVSWVRELLTGFSFASGKGAVFLEGYKPKPAE